MRGAKRRGVKENKGKMREDIMGKAREG